MKQVNVRFTEVKSVLYFDYESKRYLYVGHAENVMHGVLVGDHVNWMAVVQHALARNYKRALELAHDRGLHVVAFDLAHLRVMVNSDQLANPIPEIADLPKVSETDCRSPVGITVGLIDGMIAMARVLRQRSHGDLSAPEVQEALKDFTTDEDVRWLMEKSVQDWSFGEETHVMVGDNWELGDPLTPEHVVGGQVFRVAKRCLTWPMGWESTPITQDFNSKQELLAWLLTQCEWSMLEENGVDIEIFSMDGTSAIPMGKVKWESTQFISMPFGWKPTFENTLSFLPWLNQ